MSEGKPPVKEKLKETGEIGLSGIAPRTFLHYIPRTSDEFFAREASLERESAKNLSLMRDKNAPMEAQDNLATSSTANAGTWLNVSDELNDATSNEDYGLELPTPFQRILAVKSLPLAWRITFGVAKDCFKSGDQFPFTFGKHKADEFDATDWNGELLNELRNTRILEMLPILHGNGRMDGEGLLILFEEGFDWDNTLTEESRDTTKPIVDCLTLPMEYVNRGASYKQADWLPNGMPKYWYVAPTASDPRGAPSVRSKKFHHSRCIHFKYESIDIGTKGMSVIDRNWQAIQIGYNIDLSVGEASFRWGFGHPVFETELEDINMLKKFMENIGNPTRRTWHGLLKGVKLSFVGAGGQSLDIINNKEVSVYDEVVIGTGIARPILKGEVAGVHTGSEVNERSYWGVLLADQNCLAPVIWQVAAILSESNLKKKIPDLSYDLETGFLKMPAEIVIKWAVHYVETEKESLEKLERKVNLLNTLVHTIFTINEARVKYNDLFNIPDNKKLKPLPPAIGDQLLPIFDYATAYPEAEVPAGQAGSPPGRTYNPKLGGVGEKKPASSEGEGKKNILHPRTQASSQKNPGSPASPKAQPKGPRPQGQERPNDEMDENLEEGEEIVDLLPLDDQYDIQGCPKHNRYNYKCSACVALVKNYKIPMAVALVNHGHSVTQVAEFLHMKPNDINDAIDKE
jgi:hypothetical protein